MDASRTSHSSCSDRELVAALHAKDTSKFGELYDRYSGVLMGFALRIVKDRGEAEELLNDVFWELWKRPQRYDASRGSLASYLVTLTRSRAIDRLRARGRAQRAVPETHQDPSTTESPLDHVQIAQSRSRVRAAVQQLNPDQRDAIEMAYYDGLTHREISDELGQPLGTVKSRIRLGLIRLRDSLRSAYGDLE